MNESNEMQTIGRPITTTTPTVAETATAMAIERRIQKKQQPCTHQTFNDS